MGVVTDGVKHSMNPFDEIALEEVCIGLYWVASSSLWCEDPQVKQATSGTVRI